LRKLEKTVKLHCIVVSRDVAVCGKNCFDCNKRWAWNEKRDM